MSQSLRTRSRRDFLTMTNSLLCSAVLLVALFFIVTQAPAQRVASPTAIGDLFFAGAAAGDNFGWSVSSAGDVNGDGYSDLIVGAYLNNAGGVDAGRAYIYFGGVSMDTTADVTLTGAATGDQFGRSVSPAGDVNGDSYSDVIVGARWNNAGGSNAGRAYIYFGGVSMDNTADVTLTGAAANDEFGNSVSTAGDVNGDSLSDVIVGAYRNNAGGSTAGRVYVYFGGVSMDNTADVTLTGAAASDQFGISVSSAGDVNGDSYSDVIVGAYLNDAGGTSAGRAYVYFGGVSMDSTADVTLTGAAAGDLFGYSVSSAGNVNGDGYGDVIVGAYGNDAGGTGAGRAYVFFGPMVAMTTGVIFTGTAPGDYLGGGGMDSTADVILTGEATGDYLGISVSSAGDVNGDGKGDVIVGAEGSDSGGTDAGRVYVYHGGVSMDNFADDILTGNAAGDYLGYSVATAGDVNGDGRSDVGAGAYGNDAGGTDAGSAHVRLGGVPDIDIYPDRLTYSLFLPDSISSRTLWVDNVGTATLNVSSVSSNSSKFTVDVSSFSLNPGERRNVVVTFTSSYSGRVEGRLTFVSDDPDESEFRVGFLGVSTVYYPDPAEAIIFPSRELEMTKLISSGGSSYVSIPDSSSLDLTTSYTIEAWIKPTAFTAGLAGIVSKNHTPAANGYTLRLGSNLPYTGINFDEMESPTGILTANQWYHIAAVNDSGTRHLYVNGVEQPLSGTPLTPQANTDPLTIGVDYLPTPRYFYGTIDEVRLWDVARTARQIRENMHSVPIIDSLIGIVSYWQFNEGTGDTTIDVMLLNNGTLVNAPSWVSSTSPFGGGASNTQVVGSTGRVDFTGTDLAIDITAKSGIDTFIVTKINQSPGNSLPVEILSVSPRYWIARQYGGGTFTGNLTFTLEANTISPGDSLDPSRLKLLRRNSNTATDSAWIILTSASSATLITGEVTFDSISGSGQLAIGTTGDSPLSVKEERVPYEFHLFQNYPNPFNPTTVIGYSLLVTSRVTIKVFDMLGQEVAVLVDGMQEAGYKQVEWNAGGLPSGVYFYRLVAKAIPSGHAGSFIETKKLVLMK